jgi:hypothetical protein
MCLLHYNDPDTAFDGSFVASTAKNGARQPNAFANFVFGGNIGRRSPIILRNAHDFARNEITSLVTGPGLERQYLAHSDISRHRLLNKSPRL